MNAERAGLVHVGMSSAHPIAITAGTDGTIYISGLADDPVEVVTWVTLGEHAAAWVNSIAGLDATGPTRRDAADALRDRIVEGLKDPEVLLRTLAAGCASVAASADDDADRAAARWQEQAYLAAASLLFAAKQVARYEAAQREAAYKAGQS